LKLDFFKSIKRLFSKSDFVRSDIRYLPEKDSHDTDQFYPTSEQSLEYVAEYTRGLVRSGYHFREDILFYVADAIKDEGLKNTEAKTVVELEINKLIQEQATWPSVTDYDKLINAMKRLESKGIVARENFTCCGTCGQAEIGGEIEKCRSEGKEIDGYVFFHEQGTESAVEGYGINFSYGSAIKEASDEDHVAIGKLLADEMRTAGLKVDWNGQLSMCVMVDLDWKRPWKELA